MKHIDTDGAEFKQIVMDKAKCICSLVGDSLWEEEVITSNDGITIYAKVKKGTRVCIRANVYGTITGAGIWKNRIAYMVLEDGTQDCCIMYPEEFTVLESDVDGENINRQN